MPKNSKGIAVPPPIRNKGIGKINFTNSRGGSIIANIAILKNIVTNIVAILITTTRSIFNTILPPFSSNAGLIHCNPIA